MSPAAWSAIATPSLSTFFNAEASGKFSFLKYPRLQALLERPRIDLTRVIKCNHILVNAEFGTLAGNLLDAFGRGKKNAMAPSASLLGNMSVSKKSMVSLGFGLLSIKTTVCC